jgi:hypothetical protein
MPQIHPHVRAVMQEMQADDPVSAVRAKARALMGQFLEYFPGEPPFDLEALASFRGLKPSQDSPRHSPDSEIAPENGQVVLRVNRDRPLVRQRFSIGHEVGHTLFPEFQLAVRCRKANDRDWADPGDQLESLCDVAASEFLFPSPWFEGELRRVRVSAAGVRELAARFLASPEATIRRLVDVEQEPLAAMFCSWKLKPTEIRRVSTDRHQSRMFDDPGSTPTPKLRVDYSIANDGFRVKCCDHLPRDKSLPSDGPLLDAATTQEPHDGLMWLDLGSVAGRFRVHAIPVFTQGDRVGPNGAVSVAVLIRPT